VGGGGACGWWCAEVRVRSCVCVCLHAGRKDRPWTLCFRVVQGFPCMSSIAGNVFGVLTPCARGRACQHIHANRQAVLQFRPRICLHISPCRFQSKEGPAPSRGTRTWRLLLCAAPEWSTVSAVRARMHASARHCVSQTLSHERSLSSLSSLSCVVTMSSRRTLGWLSNCCTSLSNPFLTYD
jgi:hypothetical protein